MEDKIVKHVVGICIAIAVLLVTIFGLCRKYPGIVYKLFIKKITEIPISKHWYFHNLSWVELSWVEFELNSTQLISTQLNSSQLNSTNSTNSSQLISTQLTHLNSSQLNSNTVYFYKFKLWWISSLCHARFWSSSSALRSLLFSAGVVVVEKQQITVITVTSNKIFQSHFPLKFSSSYWSCLLRCCLCVYSYFWWLAPYLFNGVRNLLS